MTDLSLWRGSVGFASIALFAVANKESQNQINAAACQTHAAGATKCARLQALVKTLILMTLFVYWIVSASAQASSPQEAPAISPAKSIGMFAYPKNQQNADQQLKDERQCYGSAKQHTSFDPQSAPPAQPNAEQQRAQQQQAAQQAGKETPKGGTVKGGAGGAAGGAAIGAIAGSAGTGAAIGATAGAVAGRRAQKKAEKASQQQASQQTAQAQQQAQAQATAEHEKSMDSFKRDFSACMDARGYSVK